MNILHICSDFSKQSIYNQLVTHLDKLGITQKIYVPVRTAEEVGKYFNADLIKVKYQYSHILKPVDRVHYFGKISKIYQNLLSSFNLQKVSLIHAHFLFSDGGVAYKVKKELNIPYIVAVRNTDLNFFFKYFVHLRKYAIDILLNANQIVFLSHAYREQLFDFYIPIQYKEQLFQKSVIIPNGIDSYWQSNACVHPKTINNECKLLYIGEFTKNKNIHISIKAVEHLRDSGLNLTFIIVGGGGDYDNEIKKIASHFDWIHLIDRVHDKNILKNIYNNANIFAMPSKFETFGLVYIEAMSQGLPVIYSKGQGIDGYFEEGKVGYSVESGNYLDIAEKIQLIIDRYSIISNNCFIQSKNFSWTPIANTYFKLYTENQK